MHDSLCNIYHSRPIDKILNRKNFVDHGQKIWVRLKRKSQTNMHGLSVKKKIQEKLIRVSEGGYFFYLLTNFSSLH